MKAVLVSSARERITMISDASWVAMEAVVS